MNQLANHRRLIKKLRSGGDAPQSFSELFEDALEGTSNFAKNAAELVKNKYNSFIDTSVEPLVSEYKKEMLKLITAIAGLKEKITIIAEELTKAGSERGLSALNNLWNELSSISDEISNILADKLSNVDKSVNEKIAEIQESPDVQLDNYLKFNRGGIISPTLTYRELSPRLALIEAIKDGLKTLSDGSKGFIHPKYEDIYYYYDSIDKEFIKKVIDDEF